MYRKKKSFFFSLTFETYISKKVRYLWERGGKSSILKTKVNNMSAIAKVSTRQLPSLIYQQVKEKGFVETGPFLVYTKKKFVEDGGRVWRYGDTKALKTEPIDWGFGYLYYSLPSKYSHYGLTGTSNEQIINDNSLLIFLNTKSKFVKPATSYKTIWTDKGSGASHDVIALRPIPPDGYVELGHILYSFDKNVDGGYPEIGATWNPKGRAWGYDDGWTQNNDFYCVHKSWAFVLQNPVPEGPNNVQSIYNKINLINDDKVTKLCMYQLGVTGNWFGSAVGGSKDDDNITWSNVTPPAWLPLLIHEEERPYCCVSDSVPGSVECGWSSQDCHTFMTTEHCPTDPTKKACKEYCADPGSTCDKMMTTFCSTKGTPETNEKYPTNLCSCFLAQSYYDAKFEDKLNGLDKGLAQVLSTYKGLQRECYYPKCYTADFHTQDFNQHGCKMDTNIQVCLNKLDLKNTNINANEVNIDMQNECKQLVQKAAPPGTNIENKDGGTNNNTNNSANGNNNNNNNGGYDYGGYDGENNGENAGENVSFWDKKTSIFGYEILTWVLITFGLLVLVGIGVFIYIMTSNDSEQALVSQPFAVQQQQQQQPITQTPSIASSPFSPPQRMPLYPRPQPRLPSPQRMPSYRMSYGRRY